MSAPPAPPVSSPPGDPQITELQRLLRKPRAAVPQWEHVVIALRLAEDPTLDPSVGSFWKDAGVPRGKARMTIKGYAARISSEGLLANASGAEHVAAPFHCIDGELMLTSQWINENAVNLKEFRAGPVRCGRFGLRAICSSRNRRMERVVRRAGARRDRVRPAASRWRWRGRMEASA